MKGSDYDKSKDARPTGCRRTLDGRHLASVRCGQGSSAPNNQVSGLAIILITSGHLLVSILLWKLSDKVAGLVSVIFFLAAMSADLYEHFLHASQNNVFMVARGDWTTIFNVSVFILLALEILGCSLGTRMLGGWTRNDKSTPGLNSKFDKQSPKLFSGRFGYVADDFGEIV